MKTSYQKSILVLLFVLGSLVSFGQTPNKEQLVKEINSLFQSIKLWDYEGIKIENSGSLKYHICLNPECNPFVSWDFGLQNIKTITTGKFEEYDVITFTCNDIDCIVPTGYEKGGRYETKKELQFFIKDPKQGKELVTKLLALKALETSQK
jgi:hypothetical protein